jgi:lipopolysaccharide/colanic/teichoic acid biosynthesis glycosyltransferase
MPILARKWSAFLASLPRSKTHRLDWIKRAVDLSVSSAALVATAPVLAAAVLAVRVTMGRPVLFRQQRPGKNGAPFTLIKLRTMRNAGPGEESPEFDAVRMGRLGALLRSLSIDELPTLWNVLRGEMSLVGPRPLLSRYLNRYSTRQARRHEVKPGITGWAQVNGRNAVSWEDKLEMDVWYVDNRSLLLDLRILWGTLSKVIRRSGIAYAGHATMPEFRGTLEADSDDKVQVQ